jgi:hypothetical protein
MPRGTQDTSSFQEVDNKTPLDQTKFSHNVVYVFKIDPCKYDGEPFTPQQIDIINSIPVCNTLHNKTVKIGSSHDVNACITNKIELKACNIQFGRLVVFMLECPPNAAEYYEYLLLSYGTKRDETTLEPMANRTGEWIECDFGLIVNKLYDLHQKFLGNGAKKHPLSGAYRYRFWSGIVDHRLAPTLFEQESKNENGLGIFYTLEAPIIKSLEPHIRDYLRNEVEEYFNQISAIKIGMSARSKKNQPEADLTRLREHVTLLPFRRILTTWIPVKNASKIENQFKMQHDSHLHAVGLPIPAFPTREWTNRMTLETIHEWVLNTLGEEEFSNCRLPNNHATGGSTHFRVQEFVRELNNLRAIPSIMLLTALHFGELSRERVKAMLPHIKLFDDNDKLLLENDDFLVAGLGLQLLYINMRSSNTLGESILSRISCMLLDRDGIAIPTLDARIDYRGLLVEYDNANDRAAIGKLQGVPLIRQDVLLHHFLTHHS